MSFPYAVVSDVHCHSWSQFSKTNSMGINSRLQIILEELVRAATTLKKAGGTVLRVAGDLFHVRGKIEPSVFNPTYDTFRMIADMGIKIEIIPGNHDLEGHAADRVGNAMQQLEQIDGVHVVIAPEVRDEAVMVPWIEDLTELADTCIKLAASDKDLIIHAPLNGVVKGIPDLGLDPDAVAKWGYDRVFCGHYHNHKAFQNGKVMSVGATTHQTWSDPGTLAGFLIVHRDRVEHYESAAPKFVNIDEPSDLDVLSASGNYLRLRLTDADDKTLAQVKKDADAFGCFGWVDHSSKKRDTVRGTTSKAAGNMTLEVSVASFVLHHLPAGNLDKKRIAKDALGVLTEARSVGAE